MSVRPNISSLTLEGQDLVVRGEAEEPLPTILRVVVVQGGETEDGHGAAVENGPAEKIVSGWKATIKDTKLKKGPVETMGIEVRVDPFDIRSWVQSLDIE